MRAPRGVCAVLALVLVISALAAAALSPGPAAAAAWPSSNGLLLAEVVTGGSSASDEYVEIANAGPVQTDLGGCELIYTSASGATTTRKALFSAPLLLVPGQHLLVANASGIYGPLADSTYSGGLAADGGALALRTGGGSVIDAVGWGTATNQYVEGSVAAAPPAKSSLERRPGGPEGNTVDTNDNGTDWFVQANPIPQSLASTPASGATASPMMSVAPSVTAAPVSPSGAPTLEPSALQPTPGGAAATLASTPTASSTAPGPTEPGQTALPTPHPTSAGLPTVAPTASPSPTRSASTSPTASEPDRVSIEAARIQTPGALVHVIGIVTAPPGFTGTEGLFAVEDASGGVFVRWTGSGDRIVPGAEAEVVGVLAAPYGQVEIRELQRLSLGAQGDEPTPARAELSAVGEGTEARLVTVRGTVQSVTTDSGRITIVVGDGSASVRALADPPTGLTSDDVTRSDVVAVTGVVGQRASATGQADGYKIWLRDRSDLLVRPEMETPQPEAPEPKPNPTSTGVAVLRDLSSLVDRRGSAVDAEATVTAAAGLLDINGPTIVVEDGTGAVAVVMPEGVDTPRVGMRVHVTGKVGAWESGPTILASRVEIEGELRAVEPDQVSGALGSAAEWHLVQVCGRIQKVTHAGSRWRVEAFVSGQLVVILGEPAAGISVGSSAVGRLVMVTGIVRRSTSNSDEFQLLPRSQLDWRLGPAPGANSVSTPPGGGAAGLSMVALPSGGRAGGVMDIESLAGHLGLDVTVVGLVTATDEGEVTIDDGTGEVRIGGSGAAEALSLLEPGDAVEVTGNLAEDERGLLILAYPASIVILPNGEAGPSLSPASVVGPVADNEPATNTPTPWSASSIRQVSPTAPPPDVLVLLGAVSLVLVGVMACLVATRRRDLFAIGPTFLARLPRLGLLPRLVRVARFRRIR